MRERFKDFGRELKPWAVKGGYIAPMPEICSVRRAQEEGEVVPAPTHLLRHIMRADVEGSLAGFLVCALPFNAGLCGGGAVAGPASLSAGALFFLRAMVRNIMRVRDVQETWARFLCRGGGWLNSMVYR